MGKQVFNIKGMMRDVSPSKAPNQYAYEIRNLRLTAQENSTFLSLTSEKGNTQYTLSSTILGTIIGYCTLGKYLTVFTTEYSGETHTTDHIYRLEESGRTTFTVVTLYSGDLGFTKDIILETKGVYENENIQKVYWIDGVHQPRFINIVASQSIVSSWATRTNPFDFTPNMKLEENVSVEKVNYNGVFPAGTLQYVLTYYNRNGQQSAAFYQSPTFYTSKQGRGCSPEESISNAFRIKVSNIDTDFDFVRIYSIFRTSENGTPICKRVQDIETTKLLTESSSSQVFGIDLTSASESFPSYSTTNTQNFYIVDSFYREINISKFFSHRQGKKSVYFIPASYYIIKLNGEGTTVFPGTVYTASTTGQIQVTIEPNDSEDFVSIYGYNSDPNVALTNVTFRKWSNAGIRFLRTIETSNNYVSYVDSGLSGESVDYSEILYAGGTTIVPTTMESKNNTLFFGNYKNTSYISEEDKNFITENSSIVYGYSDKEVPKGQTGSFYMYENQLNLSSKEITTFKGGDTYTFGVILQDDKGQWTDVVPIGSARNPYYPLDLGTSFKPVKAFITFNRDAQRRISKYKRVKVVVLQDQPRVVCQGAVCPTVFNKDREQNQPYSMSSWFFRDVTSGSTLINHRPQAKHNGNIRNGGTNTSIPNISEIQGSKVTDIDYYNPGTTLNDRDLFVDWNTLTLHSPDIEFGASFDFNYKLRLVGALPITSCKTSMNLTWSTPARNTSINNFPYSPITKNNLSTEGYSVDLSIFQFRDKKEDSAVQRLYPIYPWHRNGSLTSQATPSGSSSWNALLETKVMASLRESAFTKFFEEDINNSYNITPFKVYQSDDLPVVIPADIENYRHSSSKTYIASVDTILTGGSYPTYSMSEEGNSIEEDHSSTNEGIRMKYKSTTHGVFSLLSEKNRMFVLPNIAVAGGSVSTTDYSNIIPVADVILLLDADNLSYTLTRDSHSNVPLSAVFSSTPDSCDILNVGDIIRITGNRATEDVKNRIWYITAIDHSSKTMSIHILDKEYFDGHTGGTRIIVNSVETLDKHNYDVQVYFRYVGDTSVSYYKVQYTYGYEIAHERGSHTRINIWYTSSIVLDTITDNASVTQIIAQKSLTVWASGETEYPYIYLAELYIDNLYSADYRDGVWNVASESIPSSCTGIEASIGDTYYQRYDCLKTYPYTLEDQNQITEIFSFMCETRINIDGRYDSRRGQSDNTTILNTNFNLLNKAYTQPDNFFQYSYLDSEEFNISSYPNQLIWTKSKVYGSKIDQWTQIIPLSTLDLDGSLGEITSLNLLNDNLICFQDRGISRINYNDKVTLSTEQGVPVELANSGKVDGNTYISTQIGCSNKQSVQVTESGIYFIDSNTREFYKWSQGLEPLSKSKSFNTFFYDKNVELDKVRTFYDPKLKDVYLRMSYSDTRADDCLVYNEQFGEFVGFFDYDADFFLSLQDSLVAIKNNTLWRQFESNDYLSFFGQQKGYSIEITSAENPMAEKIFTNLEFRANTIKQGSTTNTSSYASPNELPFDSIRAYNDYQDSGSVSFERMLRRGTNMSQKFRIWRADIPRAGKLERIRNPWTKIKLVKNAGKYNTRLDDISVLYF